MLSDIFKLLEQHGFKLICYKDMVNGRNPVEYSIPILADALITKGSLAPADKQDFCTAMAQECLDVRGLYPEGIAKALSDNKKGLAPAFKTVIINLYGAPSAGKTTTVADLFTNLKKRGRHVVQIQEYASYLINSGRTRELKEEQDLIFTKQKHKQEIAQGKFEYAITESPLLLSSYYAPPTYTASFHAWVQDTISRFQNLNFYIRKKDWSDFEQAGRIHDLATAMAIETELLDFVKKSGQTVVEVPLGVDATLWIAEWISKWEATKPQ